VPKSSRWSINASAYFNILKIFMCILHYFQTYLSDPVATNRFILCEGGASLSGECPLNQNFNSMTSLCEVQPRTVTARIPIIRSTPRSGFPNNSMRPTRTPQNIPYKSPLMQHSGISPQ
jgi:hypothetical protein